MREGISSYAEPGHYKNPPGTVAHKVVDAPGKKGPPPPARHGLHHHGGTN